MSFTGKLRKILTKTDFFHTIELLRYKQEMEYQTICGGLLSLSILLLLAIMFYGKLIDTISKNNIIAKSQNSNAGDPTPYTVSTMPGSKSMIGVQIWLFDLNSGPRYFDIVFINTQWDLGNERDNNTQIVMEPCTAQHWEGFQDVKNKIKRLNMTYWKCIPLNRTYNVQGRYSSVFSQTIDISVQKCTNKSTESRPCATQEEIDQFFQENAPFYFTIYFTNPLINPASQQYIKYYLEDTNYIMFTQSFGSQMYLFIQDYTITTDESINPISNVNSISGGMIRQFAIKNPYQILPANQVYSLITIYKSGTSWYYQRSFQKLDDLFAYVGGLFGIIILAFFVINIYNAHSFQINIATQLFHKKDSDQKNSFKNYNFFNFIAHKVYEFFKMIGCAPNWEKTKNFQQCRKQMLKQLDIMYLVQRVTFLQKVLDNIVQPHRIKGIQLHQKPSLGEAKRKRHEFKLKKKIFKLLSSKDNQNEISLDQKSENFMVKTEIQPEFYQTYCSNGIQNSGVFLANKNNMNDVLKSNDQIKYDKQIDNIKEDRWNQQYFEYDDSSSEDQEQDEQALLEQIQKLSREANEGEPISRKIWDKIDDGIKEKIMLLVKRYKRNSQKGRNNYQQNQSPNIKPKIYEQIIGLNQVQSSQVQMKQQNKKKLRIKKTFNSIQK